MNTTTTVELKWTASGQDFVIVATRDEYVAVRFSYSTRATDGAKWALFQAMDAESEGRLVEAIDAAFDTIEPVSYAVAA